MKKKHQIFLGFLGVSNKPTINFSVFSQGISTKMKSTADNRQSKPNMDK